MGIEIKVIEDLLDQLELYLSLLERMEIPSNAELIDDYDIQHLLSHRLHTAVEICIDIAAHIVSGLKLGGYQESVDIFQLLVRNKIIDKSLFEKVKDAVGERNILVHKYAKVDYPLVVRNLEKDIGDLRNFAAQIYIFLEKKGDQLA
jgi:uncharacterized protein YutE (UPF0331/DUF86 family)